LLHHASCHHRHSPNSNSYNPKGNSRPNGPGCPVCSLNDNLAAP
jgi:hypothetical protein